MLFGLGRDPFREPEVIWATLALALALLAGAAVVWAAERWRKRNERGPDPAEELTDFRAMYERGEITADEYARLRNRLAQRVKQRWAAEDSPDPVGSGDDPVPPTRGSGHPPQATAGHDNPRAESDQGGD